MAMLEYASVLNQLRTKFFPKRLSLEVQTEMHPDGNVQVIPFFRVDGQDVPCIMVTCDERQTILGYNVVLDAASQQVVRLTQARPTLLSKKRAAEFLPQLNQAGVVVRSKDGKAVRIKEAKPDVSLVLLPHDSLEVGSQLVTVDGVVVTKPSSVVQLKADEGWYAVGDDLVHVSLTDTSADKILVQDGASGTLSGNDVPTFIKLLQEEPQKVGTVEKNLSLQELSIFSGHTENRVKVSGDSESVSISPSLVFGSVQGKQYEQSIADIEHLQEHKQGFQRIPEGWIDVSQETVDGFRRACNELSDNLAGLTTVQGTDIPKTLSELNRATRSEGGWNSPWTVYYSKAVKDAH